MLNKEINSFFIFCKQHKSLCLGYTMISLLCYGFKLSHYSLGIDEEFAMIDGSQPISWIAQDRFGMAILKKIFQTSSILPFWDTFMSVFILILSCLLWSYILTKFLAKKEISLARKNFILFAFGSLYLSFPLNAVYLSFSTYNFEVSCGILLTILSIWFSYKWVFLRRKKSYLFFRH